MADDQQAQLQLHLEPGEPIEISELTGALASLGRQYQVFVDREFRAGRGADAKLLVSSVASGSIDIGLLPTLQHALPPFEDAFGIVAPVLNQLGVVTNFAKHLRE